MIRTWLRYTTAALVWIAGLVTLAVIVTFLGWQFIPSLLLGALWGYAAIPFAIWADSDRA